MRPQSWRVMIMLIIPREDIPGKMFDEEQLTIKPDA